MQVLETVQTNIAFSSLLKRYTLEEFWALPEPADRSHYELIEGVLYIVPPPANPQGKIIANLNRSLMGFLIAAENPGNVYHPREAIYIEDIWGTYLEPDMMFVSAELEERMGERRTSADIVFECLSESTGVYDRTTKADTYLALGVKELWLIDSDNETVEVRNADAQEGVLFWQKRRFTKGETAESKVLEDWKVSVSEVFAK
ncbi:MAG TPA: Uma2 family endonuclease [Pyrinomonadaceae bacterium]|nr:Uma2 family endonuclease [Pyrinomonadaceae bacterium]